jgi:vacuolar-type H+-ATPase subunit I/STV1
MAQTEALRVPGSKHSQEIAKLTTGLLIGILALMTFLLSVGLQHPKTDIEIFMYGSLGTLGLGLLAYEIGSMLKMRAKMLGAKAAPKDKEAAAALKTKQESAQKTVMVAYVIQRVIFILSIIAVVGFGVVATELFFPAAVATPTSAPSSAVQ